MPERITKLVVLNWKGNYNKQNPNNSLIICDKQDIDEKIKWHYAEVRDGIYVMVGGSATTIMHVLKVLIDAYNINQDDFSISVRAKK